MSKLTGDMRREGKVSSDDIKVIGLMVEDLFADFSREVITNVYNTLLENDDCRLVVMAGKYDDDSYIDEDRHAYLTVCNSIYNLVEKSDIDGLIISLGSLNYLGEAFLHTNLMKHFKDIPKIFISTSLPGCVSVRYDNEQGIREAIDVLVNVYGITKICMLGGRSDNQDAILRKQIFRKCLKERNIPFPYDAFIETDMSVNCEEEAEILLEKNPGVEAVFCVNDAVAVGLYNVMGKRGLVPGEDIKVFGFDNTQMSGELIPSLSSIGSRDTTVGRRAVELLNNWMRGESVTSEFVPTMLYSRRSLEIDMFDLFPSNMSDLNDDFINRMFDECFYRYAKENYLREKVNLKRLFFEVISRMTEAIRRRYISPEEFYEIGRLVDIFIENGAMDYTDTRKMMRSVERLQELLNNISIKSFVTNSMINRLFLRFKDKVISSLSEQRERESRRIINGRDNMRLFLSKNTDYTGKGPKTLEDLISTANLLGVDNAALFLYGKPVKFVGRDKTVYPDTIDLKCVIKDGKLQIPSKDRQNGSVSEMFARSELSSKIKGYIAFPVFHGVEIYGILACDLTRNVFDRGEYIADQLGRMIFEVKK